MPKLEQFTVYGVEPYRPRMKNMNIYYRLIAVDYKPYMWDTVSRWIKDYA